MLAAEFASILRRDAVQLPQAGDIFSKGERPPAADTVAA